MKQKQNDFIFKKCSITDLPAILEIQNETVTDLKDKELLRINTIEMLEECFIYPNIVIGAWLNGNLAGFNMLYFPKDSDESLADDLKNVNAENLISANNKLCIVKKSYRGNNLQYLFGEILEKTAREMNVNIICATVHPDNSHSIANIEKLGYKYDSTKTKYDSIRNLYYKILI